MPGLAAVAIAGVAGWVLRGGVAGAGVGADDTENGESPAAGIGSSLAAAATESSGRVGASEGEGEGEGAGASAGTGARANVAVVKPTAETASEGAAEGATRTPGAPVRVYMDGCFDCMHFGHANALRQAAALGDVLVVGINPEAEIRVHKGPPVMSDWERRVAVEGVKWVDEILEGVPYAVTPEFLKELIDVHRIDFIVHGDDPCIGADGEDVYKAVKAMGKFRTIKRTEGVSSTDIVGRMLLCTRDHHVLPEGQGDDDIEEDGKRSSGGVQESDCATGGVDDGDNRNDSAVQSGTVFTRESTFLPTTRRLVQFAGTPRAPAPGDRVVYVDGTWDMFHAGHIETLRAARAKGDFLLVGIHDDATANRVKGGNFPIMNLHERTLSVLSCKHVDEVIIGAPWCVTEDMITTMNIAVVVHGTHRDPRDAHAPVDDTYAVPKRLGIYEEIQSSSELTVPVILQRIVNNRGAYLERNAKKEKSEADYLTNHKTYVPEG